MNKGSYVMSYDLIDNRSQVKQTWLKPLTISNLKKNGPKTMFNILTVTL